MDVRGVLIKELGGSTRRGLRRRVSEDTEDEFDWAGFTDDLIVHNPDLVPYFGRTTMQDSVDTRRTVDSYWVGKVLREVLEGMIS